MKSIVPEQISNKISFPGTPGTSLDIPDNTKTLKYNLYMDHIANKKVFVELPSDIKNIELMRIQINNVKENQLNKTYQTYSKLDIPDDIIINFLNRGGNFKYVNKANLSENVWKHAIDMDEKNFLYIPPPTLFQNIKNKFALIFHNAFPKDKDKKDILEIILFFSVHFSLISSVCSIGNLVKNTTMYAILFFILFCVFLIVAFFSYKIKKEI